MSRLSKQDYIGISWGDLHLSDDKPGCRAERDWFNVMRRHLQEVCDLQRFLNVPVLCTGDIFDKWDPSPELLNLAINNFPSNCCAVPGNHDLYFHSYRDIAKTGYGVLDATNIIENVPWRLRKKDEVINFDAVNKPFVKNSRDCFLDIYGFPYDVRVFNLKEYDEPEQTFGHTVALVHAYVWESNKNKHFKAKQSADLNSWKSKIKDYDFILFGDNHSGFISGVSKKKNICNTGTFMRRTIKEIDYRPFVGLLRADGNIEKYELQSPNKDCFNLEKKALRMEKESALRAFWYKVGQLESKSIDFAETLKIATKKYQKNVARMVMKILSKYEAKNEKK